MLDHKHDLLWIKEADVSTILHGKDEEGQPHLLKVFRVYRKVFGEACQNCPNKVLGYINSLKSLNLNIMANQFKLNGTGMFLDTLTRSYISNHNLTDETALRFLKGNPNRIGRFSKFPEDWKEQVESYEVPSPKAAKAEQKENSPNGTHEEVSVESEGPDQVEHENLDTELTLKELRAKYPHITARSKKEFLEELNA